MASSGAVSHFFNFVGLVHVLKSAKSFDEIFEIALGSGASDLEDEGDSVGVYTNHGDLHNVKIALEKSGLTVSHFEMYFRPTSVITVTDKSVADKLIKLLHVLEDLEDVQKVYTNADVIDEALS